MRPVLVQSPAKERVLPLVWSICWQPPLWCVGCPLAVHVHLVAVCEHLNDGTFESVYSTRVSPLAVTKHLGAFGHAAVLHTPVGEPGQLAPPWAGAGLVHVRDCEPLPQNWVQESKADQPPSMGHTKVLQGRVWELVVGQASPPKVGAVLVRPRLCAPVAHDLEQVVQAFHEPMMQSTAQAPSLQLRVSFRYGHT